MISFASPWPAVAGADTAQVTVVSPGGLQRPLSLDALAGSENVHDQAFVVRSPSGEETRTVTGFSLAAVLEAAGADPYSFSYLEVLRPVGGSVLLSRHQALDPGAFPEGPPLVYATPNGTTFLRPASDSEDANGGDCFEVPQGVTVVLRKGSPLRVRAHASELRVRARQEVDFDATVEGAGAGEQLEYSWYFDDGGSATGASANHSFAKRGSYDVVVGVTTTGDDTGVSAVVTVEVGALSSGGPDRKGGGDNHNAAAPDSGAASGPSGSVGVGAGSSKPARGATAAADGTPAPPSHDPARPSKPERRKAQPTGERVSGLLLSGTGNGAGAAPEEQPTAPVAARTGTLREGDGGGGLPTGAWGILVSLGLLGTGVLIEAGGFASLAARFGR